MNLPLALFIAKDLALKGFSNLRSLTTRDLKLMAETLNEITKRLSHSSFQIEGGQTFALEQVNEAIEFTGQGLGKVVLSLNTNS